MTEIPRINLNQFHPFILTAPDQSSRRNLGARPQAFAGMLQSLICCNKHAIAVDQAITRPPRHHGFPYGRAERVATFVTRDLFEVPSDFSQASRSGASMWHRAGLRFASMMYAAPSLDGVARKHFEAISEMLPH